MDSGVSTPRGPVFFQTPRLLIRPDWGVVVGELATSGTRTVLFTDLVGSTSLRTSVGDRAADDIRRDHDALLGDAVVAHFGTVVKSTGDGIMAVFESASEAAAAAVEMQQAMDCYGRRTELDLRIRVGLSAGDVTWEHDDYFGTPVVEAARLEAAASAGQILAAEVVRVLAGSRTDLQFDSVEPLTLKGLAGPMDVMQIGWDPLPTTGPIPLPRVIATGSRRRFVGREAELARLDVSWRDATNGELRIVILEGEAGIGKTRLGNRFAAGVHEFGAIVLFGRSEQQFAVPYQPFVEAFRYYVDHVPARELDTRLGRHPGELTYLLPELSEHLHRVVEPLQSDAETNQFRFFEAVASWLAAASAADPIVLVLDDLQWTDAQSLVLLRHIAHANVPMRVLVLATWREHEQKSASSVNDLLAALRRDDCLDRIRLDGLQEGDVAMLITDAVDTPETATADLVRRIVRETNGNAFFVDQILLDVADAGQLPDDILVVPSGVREAVGRRLALMSKATRDVLARAAVLGTEFEAAVLEKWPGATPEAVLSSLDEASDGKLVEERELDRFAFVHAIVRTTISDGLSVTRRAWMHQEAAAAIEAAFPQELDARAAELAFHCTASPRRDPESVTKAVAYLIRAGDAAGNAFAYDESIDHYEQALSLVRQEGLEQSDADHCDLFLALGSAQLRAGRPEGRGVLLEAAALAQELADPSRLAQAALANNPGHWSVVFDVDPERVVVIEAALALGGPARTATRARLLGLLAVETEFTRPRAERQRITNEAVAIARELHDDATLADALTRQNTATYHPATLDQRLKTAEELQAIALRLEDPLIAYYAAESFSSHLEAGDLDQADRCLEDQRLLVEELGQPYFTWCHTAWHQTCRALHSGHLDVAERLATEGLQLGAEIRDSDEAFNYYGNAVAMIRFEQGRLAELIPLMEDLGTERIERSIELRMWLALAHTENGDNRSARELMQSDLMQHLDVIMDAGHTLLSAGAQQAELADRLGQPERAERALEMLGAFCGRVATVGLVSWGAVDRYVGLCMTVLGNQTDAADAFEAAIECNRRTDAPTWEARARLDLAAVLRSSTSATDRARALELAESALQTAHAFRLQAVATRARDILGRS